MTRARSIAVACGLAGLLGLGAAAVSRGQQAELKGDAKVSPRKALRDRVVTLRAEVEVLQLEHDADRADLLDESMELRRLSRGRPDRKLFEGVAGNVEAFIKMSADERKEFIDALSKDDHEDPEFVGELATLKNFAPAASASEVRTEARAVMRLTAALGNKEVKKREKALRTEIDQKREGLRRRATELNEKKLDLEEAEIRYREVR